MTKIKFRIEGNPQGKGRPRACRIGKGVRMYTPKKTADYEKLVQLCFKKTGQKKLDGPVTMIIHAYMSIPKSATKKDRAKMLNCEILPTKKPDLDNIAKIILDALNGLAYDDDKQIVSLSVAKFYSATPRVDVVAFELSAKEEEKAMLISENLDKEEVEIKVNGKAYILNVDRALESELIEEVEE